MSLQIDDLDQIDGESTQTSNDDIFSNPLEAFPEFIDEPVQPDTNPAEPEPEPVMKTEEPAETPAAEPVKEEKKPAAPKKSARSSSVNYIDPLDTIEEIDLSSLSQAAASFSFDDEPSADSVPAAEADATGAFFQKSNLTLGTIEYEDVAVRKTEGYYDIDDSVPDEMSGTEEVSVDDFLSGTGTETEEVDLDSFLGDSSFSDGAPSANITEEVSLDDFGVDFSGIDADAGIDVAAIDAFAASMKQERTEKSDIENAPAIEMELVFDDEFVLETKANPEDDIDFDFEALMAGESVEMPQQAATGDELLDNFDDIFNNIVDEGSPSPAPASDGGIEFDPSAIEEVSLDDFGLGGGSSPAAETSGEAVSEQQITFDEVSEFDDLLSSFSDDTHVEVAEKQTARSGSTGPHDYNIIVVMDDDDETTAAPVQAAKPVSEDTEEEDYVVSIFKTEDEAEKFRNHDKPAVSQAFESSEPSSGPVEFTGGSDSFEDISLEDFGVTFEDETPAETKPAAETEEVLDDAGTPADSIPETEPDFMEEEEPVETHENLDIPEDEPDFMSMDMPDIPEEAETTTEAAAEIPENEPELSVSELPDIPDMAELPDMPEIPEQQEISFEEQFGDVPTVDDIIKEAESSEPDLSEEQETVTECEDTTADDKIIVVKSENCVYNGDNTEDTSNMIDENNEEITDTMNSKNEGLLEQIVSELSVLRNEMQNLRDEVQTLKGGAEPAFEEPAPAPQDDFALPETDSEPAVEEAPADDFVMEEPAPDAVPSEDAAEDIPLPEADPFAAPQEAGGFFSGDDDDETIALSGDELNNILNSADFTQEDGSNFGMEAPEGSILPDDLGDGFAMEPPAEEPAVEEAPADDFAMDEPVIEEPAPEAPAEEAEAPAVDDFDINFDEPAVEESVPAEEPALDEPAPETEEISIDDFDTDLPSLKDDSEPSVEAPAEEAPADDFAMEEPAVEAPAEEAAPEAAETDFSLDEFDIPEPSVDESSIADIDIDEPDTEPKAEEELSLDEFDIPEPSVDSITDIDIDEPASDIPSDEPAAPSEDTDFYANSDSPAISEDDISAIDIQENLEEPVLDDIDFGMDEPVAEDIEIPTGDNLIVDSSSTDFLEEDDPTIDEQLTSEKVDYLNEEASADDLGSLPEIEDIPDASEEAPAVEGMEDSLEADTLATSEDETPADDMFSSQWDEAPAEAPVFEDEPVAEEEEIVQAATSFDDPIGFDIEDVPSEAPAEEEVSFDEPADEEPAAEPAFDAVSDYEAPAAEEPAAEQLSGDIKQEVKSVLKYMDQLLENLPEDKIAEFAQSEHFETYKKLFNELGLV